MWLQTLAPQSFGNYLLQLHRVRLQVHSIFTFKPTAMWTLQFIDNIKQAKRLTCLPMHTGRQFPLGVSAPLPSDQRSDRNRTVVHVQEWKHYLPAQLELSTSWSQPRAWAKGQTEASNLCLLEKMGSNTVTNILLCPLALSTEQHTERKAGLVQLFLQHPLASRSELVKPLVHASWFCSETK